ncbi:MAG: hypothetical protein OEY64_11335, partial [Nitrospinota bacterium]|nr:hypothetical protein [Nitrospinota bacterium]
MGNSNNATVLDPEEIDKYSDKIYPECVRILYRVRARTILTHISIVLATLYTGWTEETWFSNLLLVSAFFLYLLFDLYSTRKFNSSAVPDEEIKSWGRRLYYNLAVVGLSYNIIYMNLAFHGVENAMVYLIVITALFSIGAVTIHIYLKGLSSVYIISAMVPQSVYYLVADVEGGVIFSICLATFVVGMTIIGLQINNNAIRTLALNHLLQDAKEKAENATKLKDKFVSLVSHDLRGPIS